jgi:hypothetical protein
MAKKNSVIPVSNMIVKKPRKAAVKASEASGDAEAPKVESAAVKAPKVESAAVKAAKAASIALEVFDHVAKKTLKMGKRQFDILSKTTYTEGRSKFLRYTLGNVKKAAITKND